MQTRKRRDKIIKHIRKFRCFGTISRLDVISYRKNEMVSSVLFARFLNFSDELFSYTDVSIDRSLDEILNNFNAMHKWICPNLYDIHG